MLLVNVCGLRCKKGFKRFGGVFYDFGDDTTMWMGFVVVKNDWSRITSCFVVIKVGYIIRLMMVFHILKCFVS